MLAADMLALPACAFLSSWLVSPNSEALPVWTVAAASGIGILAMHLFGLYRSIVRFMGLELVIVTFKIATLVAVALAIGVIVVGNGFSATKTGLAFWLLSTVYIAGSRLVVRLTLRTRQQTADRVVIYGAGEAGVNLATAILSRGEFTLVGFVDDSRALHGSVINGLEVHAPSALEDLNREFGVSKVFLALPSISRRRRQKIISELEKLSVHVLTIPDIHDIISGNAQVDDIREVDIADLLGRDTVPPSPDLLGACISQKSVMVTGAGGSIGSELCQQIIRHSPRILILLEISEPALYAIDQKLREAIAAEHLGVVVVPLIGSAHHRSRVLQVLKTYKVDTIYHAAAYKHVPLVEHNMIEGIHNNVFGTLHTAEAAVESGVQSFVLISTDKAVKPTNVMGAAKRFSELVLQAMNDRGVRTRFSIVRFGNVLESSGSVVPLFRDQIRNGGPVTVTHPDICRYFMTIPEAASLVLQAGSMANGGEVFVLDMGESVRIADLAQRMIHLMGLTVRERDNPEGDIEIKYTGLRPAEKLFEELLIGDNASGTQHPRIMQAKEDYLPWRVLKPMLDELWSACLELDCEKARSVLLRAVVEYVPAKRVEDLVWRERSRHVGGSDVTAVGNVTPLEPRRGVPLPDRT